MHHWLQLRRSALALAGGEDQVLQLRWHRVWAGLVPQHGPHVLAGVVGVIPGAIKAGLQSEGEEWQAERG